MTPKQKTKKRKAGQETIVTAAWRASRPGLAAVVFFSAFVNILKFAMPIYLLQVLDRVPASRSAETLFLLTLMAIAAIAFAIALDIVRRRMLARWGIWIERRFGRELVRRGLLEGVAGGDFYVDRELANLAKLRNFVSRNLAGWFDLIWVPAFFVVTFFVHPYLGLMALGGVAILLILGVLQTRLSAEPFEASSSAHRKADDLVNEASRNRESVGALGMAGTLADRWNDTESGRLAERERIDSLWLIFRTLMRALRLLLGIGLIATGIWLMLRDEISLGSIFAARITALFGYGLCEAAIRNFRGLTETCRIYAKLKRVLETTAPSETEVHPGTGSAALKLDDVTHRHSGHRQDLFKRLSVEVAPGELLLVNGEGGVGKTTLVRMIVGSAKPRYGKVFLGDTEVASLPATERNRLIGYLPQHTEIFAGTVRQNIARMDEGSLAEVSKAAQLVGIHDFILGLPEGYDTELIADTFDRLSGSQRKRIALARAIYQSPRLLVLDEPVANLDSPSRRIVEGALRQLKEEGAIVVVTQSVRSAQFERMADKYIDLKGSSFSISSAKEGASEAGRKAALRSVK